MATVASFTSSISGYDALVIGATQLGIIGKDPDAAPSFELSAAGGHLDADLVAKIDAVLKASKFTAKSSDTRTLFAISDAFPPTLVVVGLGKRVADPDKRREQSRVAAAAAVSAVRAISPNQSMKILVAPFGDVHGLAEGSVLVQHSFDELKAVASRSIVHPVSLFVNAENSPDMARLKDQWKRGLVLADAQNIARRLAETPANLMTPTIFCEQIAALLSDESKVTVFSHGPEWIEQHKMGSFASVGRGSVQPQRLLEIHYAGDPAGWDAPKVGLVGKGVTFDSGGLSIKSMDGMTTMRADMLGAAEVMAATYAAAKLGLKINVVSVAALTENMPSGNSTKVGDVVLAMNGKTIEVNNTDAEGRLVLADALYYVSSTYKPRTLIDVATLTYGIMVALGSVYNGAFCSSQSLADRLVAAGKTSGDEIWPMPLNRTYLLQMKSPTADLKNFASQTGGACTAAAFLQEFVDGLAQEESEATVEWAHVDIAGTMVTSDIDAPYLKKGQMSGRPTRTLIEFLEGLTE